MPLRICALEMIRPPHRTALLALLAAFLASHGSSLAQSDSVSRSKSPSRSATPQIPRETTGTTDSEVVSLVRRKISVQRAALNRQRQSDGLPLLAEPALEEPQATVDIVHYGIGGVHAERGPQRFLILRLLIDNPGPAEWKLSEDDLVARIAEERQTSQNVPPLIQNFNFLYAGEVYALQKVKQFTGLTIPPRGVGTVWLFFPKSTANSEVPAIRLTLTAGGHTIEIDVTESQRALLGLSVERLGPRGCLAFVSVSGLLNTINAQSLADRLESLAERKTVRFVLQWTDDAPLPDLPLLQWLAAAAAQAGSGHPGGEHFPDLPAAIRELHLVQPRDLKSTNSALFGSVPAQGSWHESADEAVGAALRTAYLSLPKHELLHEIRQGHPLARAAAITHGAEQLDAHQLSELIRWAHGADPPVQLAAIRALSHFPEQAAVNTLEELARQKQDPVSAAAVESLAGSRFSAAENGLWQLLHEPDPTVKRLAMQVLARHPPPKWSETIFEYVTSSPDGLDGRDPGVAGRRAPPIGRSARSRF
ncbi:MAG: HEAT repeat domain-containing protein [Planctomycetaceae bacterium]